MINLLIELYDYPCGVDFYYIQDNDVKEFGDEIFKKINKIAVELLIYRYFVDNCAEIEKERKKAISKISDEVLDTAVLIVIETNDDQYGKTNGNMCILQPTV